LGVQDKRAAFLQLFFISISLQQIITMLKFAAVVCFIAMSYLFFMPAANIPKIHWMEIIFFDKWVHLGLFALFVGVSTLAFANPEVNNTHIRLLLAAILYGIVVEIIQFYFIKGRSFSIYDILADTLGALIGAKWAYKLQRKQ